MCRYIFPLTADPPIQFIENNVGEQRGEDTSLRRSLIGVNFIAVGEYHGGFQHFSDDTQQFLVLYAQCPHLPHEFGVIDIIEKSFNIYIYHKIEVLDVHHLHALGDCVLS